MTNLYEAHKQWATRPPDERFATLGALHSFAEDRRHASAFRKALAV